MSTHQHPTIATMHQHQVPWLPPQSQAGDIVLSCRVRLARNLHGLAFPNRLDGRERRQALLRIADAIGALPDLADAFQADLGSLTEFDRRLLIERRLIEGDTPADTEGLAVCIAPDEAISLTVNEIDHLRLWVVGPGIDLDPLLRKAMHLESQLSERLEFAFDDRLGYLASRPRDLGTGLRAGVLLHLPGLALTNHLDQVREAMDAIGLVMEPLYYDDEHPLGNLFEISNAAALGESEENQAVTVQRVATNLATQERQARQLLVADHPGIVVDTVGRAYGILRYAYQLTTSEAVGMLSAIRLGIDLGTIESIDVPTLNRMLLCAQPAHLAAELGRTSEADSEEQARAELMRRHLGHAGKPRPGKD